MDTLPSNADLMIYTLKIIGPEYHEIFAAIHARDNTITFKELRDKLTEYESFLKREDQRNKTAPVIANAMRFSKLQTFSTIQQQWSAAIQKPTPTI